MFKIVVSDPKTKKTYQKEVGYKESGLVGKRIGEKFKGDLVGLSGYELQITGGSDKQGFPMRPDIAGATRKKMLLTGGPGFHPTTEGERRRKLVRGNTVSEDIVQVNIKVLTHGKETLAKLFGKEEAKEKKAEEKKEEKPAEQKKPEEKKAEQAAAPVEKKEEKQETKPEAKQEKPAEQKEREKKPEAESKAEQAQEAKKD